MLTLDRVRELLCEPKLSDTDAEAIRDACRTWAELALIALRHQSAQSSSILNTKQEERDLDARLLDVADRGTPRI